MVEKGRKEAGMSPMIKGRVIDAITGKGIPNAALTIGGGISFYSDNEGNIEGELPPEAPRVYFGTIRAEGYVGIENIELMVHADYVEPFSVELSPKVEVQELRVSETVPISESILNKADVNRPKFMGIICNGNLEQDTVPLMIDTLIVNKQLEVRISAKWFYGPCEIEGICILNKYGNRILLRILKEKVVIPSGDAIAIHYTLFSSGEMDGKVIDFKVSK